MQTPVTSSEAQRTSGITNPSASLERTTERKIEASTDAYSARNYKPLYRAAHDFHERHNPPTVDREYWRTHTAGEDEAPQVELDYWVSTAADMGAIAGAFDNDPFLTGLLAQVYLELEREYIKRRDVR